MSNDKKTCSFTDACLAMVAGVGVGVGLGVLMAPKRGEDLRADIAGGLNDGMEQVRHRATAAKEAVSEAIVSGKAAFIEKTKNVLDRNTAEEGVASL